MLIAATAMATALTSFGLCPSASAQAHQKAAAPARRANPPVPLAAFGALAGAAASIAAAERQRETYGPYYSPSYAPRAFGPEPRQTPRLVTRPAAGTL
jgi:hypothetical protein